MVISSINCSSRTYKYSRLTRGPLLVLGAKGGLGKWVNNRRGLNSEKYHGSTLLI